MNEKLEVMLRLATMPYHDHYVTSVEKISDLADQYIEASNPDKSYDETAFNEWREVHQL